MMRRVGGSGCREYWSHWAMRAPSDPPLGSTACLRPPCCLQCLRRMIRQIRCDSRRVWRSTGAGQVRRFFCGDHNDEGESARRDKLNVERGVRTIRTRRAETVVRICVKITQRRRTQCGVTANCVRSLCSMDALRIYARLLFVDSTQRYPKCGDRNKQVRRRCPIRFDSLRGGESEAAHRCALAPPLCAVSFCVSTSVLSCGCAVRHALGAGVAIRIWATDLRRRRVDHGGSGAGVAALFPSIAQRCITAVCTITLCCASCAAACGCRVGLAAQGRLSTPSRAVAGSVPRRRVASPSMRSHNEHRQTRISAPVRRRHASQPRSGAADRAGRTASGARMQDAGDLDALPQLARLIPH